MRSSIKRVMVFALTLCMLLSFVPPFEIDVFAADSYTFDFTKDSPVIVINQALIDNKGTSNFVIPDGAYSVTVNGDIEVNIIFDKVTINRYESVSGATADQLYAAGVQLGWTRAGGGVYVPTVPFLITGGAKVNARFDGECVFRAGTNGWYVSNSDSVLRETWAYYGGYAGIQVDSGASLTIIGADDLYAFGAYQYYGKDKGVPTTPKEMLAAAIAGTPIFEVGAAYEGPTGYMDQENGGGAGIGGGTSYNTSVITSGGSYTVGTPGEIIINSGKITAVGGHTAAGIGGGVNSAATSSQIVINGGKITAVGGRFAAGIGDGDSTNNKESDTFSNSYHIEINGGTVKAYGGTASAGIGTTDNVTILNGGAEGKTSGLSITLNGGDITAQSGEPEGANEATAAIGSGKNTDMADNSITVNSAAYVSAASFSKYAISNKGTNIDEAPSIIVDPNGYIYFIRFAENINQRTFKLYPVKRDKLGNPMLVNTTASDLLDGIINSPTYSPGTRDEKGQIRYYACDSEQGKYYRVDEYGNPLRVKPGHDNNAVIGNSDLQITQDKGSIYYPGPNIEPLTYYYDTNNPIRTYTVPGNYKAVAISLPLPELYGGRYVLHAPYKDASAKDDDIYALIKKTESGPNSSELHDGTEDYPISQTHVPFGPNSTNRETPNMSVDPTAGSFLNIDVFKYNSDNTLDSSYDYIGDDVFSRGTYGYTVYMPTGTERVHIDLYFSNTETTDEGKTTTYESLYYIGDAVLNYGVYKVEQTAADPITYTAECDVDITSGYEVVWFKKTDKTTDINGEEITVTVTYRIVIVVKPEYEFGIADMDKTYDGAAVSAEVNGMFMYSFTGDDPTQYDAGISIEQDTNDIASYIYTYGRYGFNVQVAKESTGTDDDGQHYIQYTTLISYGDQQISVNTKYYITGKYVQEIPNDNYFEIGRYRYYIVENENDRSIGIKRGRDGTVYNIVDFNYFNLVSSTYDLSDLDKAREDLKNAGIIGGKEAYEVYRKDNYIVTIKRYSSNNDDTPEEIERKFNIILTVNGTVTYNKEDISSILTDEDRNSINYTYYSYDDADGNGTYDEGEAKTLLSSAPKDAGTYFVVAELETKKYEAYGMKCFTISKREIKIVSIQNWHTTVKDLAEFTPTIGNPGAIYFDDVIQGDTVTLDEDADGYTVAYNDKTIGYSDVKIKITNPVLSAESGKNYVLTGLKKDSGNYYYYLVPGQISYDTTGAMFKKTETGQWRKFFPTTEDTYLIFDGTDKRVDYHSPSSTKHLEHIKARTIGSGERGAKYAVDIEYGNMEFTYSKTVWDVNNYSYEEVPNESRWGGFDDINNKITIKNRSNREVKFSIESGIHFLYQMQGDSEMGIESILYHYPKGKKTEIKQPDQTETPQFFTVDKATPPEGEETQGTAGEYYVTLELTGTPQIGASDEFTTVGWITVTILKTTTTNTP